MKINVSVPKADKKLPNRRETKAFIKELLTKKRVQLSRLEEGKTSHSVLPLYHETLGKILALEAILSHLNGNSINIKKV
jgi:hypothetical protein